MNSKCASVLMVSAGLMLPAASIRAYDYAQPMQCVPAVPLGYPTSPFVLRFSPEELRSQPVWSNRVDAIVISRNASSPVRIGAETLQASLTGSGLGKAEIVALDPASAELPENLSGRHLLVLGTPQDSALVAALSRNAGLEVTDQALNGDGFIIKPLQQGTREILLVTSPAGRGVLYGAYELEERTSRRGVPRIDEQNVPSVRYRNWPIHLLLDPPAEVTGRWRLNTVIVPNNITFSGNRSAFLYPGFPELGCEQNKEKILADEKFMHNEFATMARYGGVKMMMWNPLMLPIHSADDRHSVFWAPDSAKLALEKKYPGMLAQPWDNAYVDRLGPDRYCLCPSHPMTRKFVEEGAREMMRTFPEVDTVIIQLSDGGGELFCGCDRCKRYPYMDRVVDYARLAMATMQQENPRIKFVFSVTWEWLFTPLYYPEYRNDPTGGLVELRRRLGPDVVAFLIPPNAPPLGDQRGWHTPDTTLLGHDVPLYTYFFYYEIWGIGIARPLSTIATHLSWVLPIDLQKLQKFTEKGQMVGAMSPDMGVEVGIWHPQMDAGKYLRNWCRAKYGEKAGDHVYRGLLDTYKITEGFLLETKPAASESVTLYRWGEFQKAWATGDMNAWWERTMGYAFRTGKYDLTQLEISVPQAPAPDALRNITPPDLDKWLKRFELPEQTAIAARSEAMLAQARASAPDDREIRTLHEIARGTVILVDLYKEYHRAFIHARLARNLPASPERDACIARARGHLKAAINRTAEYDRCCLPIAEADKSYLPTKTLYLPFISMMVREGAYLFDQEFPGDSLLTEMDRAFAVR